MPLESSYTARSAGSLTGGSEAASTDKTEYWELEKLRKCYLDYLFSKREEIDEQIDARRYYHGSQYTAEQLKTLRKRRQPAMTFNHIGRKIDGTVGQIENLRQDPKAYARTPQHEEGAELATAVLRYVLDQQEWRDKSPGVAHDGAIDGIGGFELDLIEGDQGDPEISLAEVDIQAFFYDPKSYKPDFSDARYMGVTRMMDEDLAEEKYPGAPDGAFDSDSELQSSSDREQRWFSTEGTQKKVRIVEIWYKHKGKWCWAEFSGNAVLKEGVSPFADEKKKSQCRFIMFSCNVDQDGDRYGFVRNMKSAQDGINAKHSKVQHIMSSNKLFISQGAASDVEKTRAEFARPDGVIVTHSQDVRAGVQESDRSFDFTGWTKLLEFSLAEIEGFGPNRELVGDTSDAKSGRAIALRQQAGMAELGPYILAYRGWKVRVYRAIWNACQQHWKGERWVRVTDDEQVGHFVGINQMQPGPMGPQLVNAIGSLDVDIILDEGPDTVNMMQDLYESLQQIVPAVAPLMPQMAGPLVGMLIENSPLPASAKKKYRDAQEQMQQQPPPPDPEIVKAEKQLELKQIEGQQHIQLEREKAAAQFELEQAKTVSTIQLEQQKAEADFALEQRRMEFEGQRQREQAQFDLSTQQQKGELDLATQGQKTAIDMDSQRQKMDLDRQAREQELQHQQKSFEITVNCEQDKAAAKTGGVTTSNVKAFQEIAEGFKEGMALIAKAMTEPKKIAVQRDASGKVTGATAR